MFVHRRARRPIKSGPSKKAMLRTGGALPHRRDPYDGAMLIADSDCQRAELQSSFWQRAFFIRMVEPQEIDGRAYLRWVLEEPFCWDGPKLTVSLWCSQQFYPGSTLWAWVNTVLYEDEGIPSGTSGIDTNVLIDRICALSVYGQAIMLEPLVLTTFASARDRLRRRLESDPLLKPYAWEALALVDEAPLEIASAWIQLCAAPTRTILDKLRTAFGDAPATPRPHARPEVLHDLS